ncbi:alpha-L-fucosidase [Flavivirga algicola]|uniref:alpha-L-fucosidase n=1 Tax=Flavivirga algicola TaxID=2729136 RepID=A0ABX1RUF3_9FLAO|nr:alpha-L-fucosidase [Flavivirga algicola]NMH86811.1 alpha-L-fucosidase [Flavivirga algicola]
MTLKHISLIIFLLVFGRAFSQDEATNSEKGHTYEANWESIRSRYKIPDWFRDAKFGIFIHWGPYAVPAKGDEKYPKYMYYKDHIKKDGFNTYEYHQKTYGNHKEFGYKDFIPMFKAKKFKAEKWARLFKKSGARYVVPVAEHHDAFAMYNSNYTRWNAVNMGPKKDILGALAEAVRKQGIKFGTSSHLANWRNYYWKKTEYDNSNTEYVDLYWKPVKNKSKPSQEFLDTWWNRTTDIIDQYQPDLLWFDFGLDKPGFESVHSKILSYYYNKGEIWNKEVVFQNKNMRNVSFPEDLIVLDIERGRMDNIFKYPWQTDTSVGYKSWGYIDNEDYKTSNYLIDELIDIVSKNGCLLLNIGPKADGTIPQESVKILTEIGDWLKINGEAIYDTRPWLVYGEGPTQVNKGHHSEKKNKVFTSQDVRFTQKKGVLYATVLDWPKDNVFTIKTLSKLSKVDDRSISSVEFISGKNKINWSQTNHYLTINIKGKSPCKAAYVFKIEFKN